MSEFFKVSAPGKLMLLGEHAVLHGKRSLVCAVNQRMVLKFTRRNDENIQISSDLGDYSAKLDELSFHPRFRFIIASLKLFGQHLHHGFDLEITSDFSDQVGLGSSAAVTAAMLGGIQALEENYVLDKQALFQKGIETIKLVQGAGSGADLAASIFGGIMVYRSYPLEITPYDFQFPITVVYSGSKVPTTTVIEKVNMGLHNQPCLFKSIFNMMDESVAIAGDALKKKDLNTVGELFNINQGLMDALGVCTDKLAEINYALRKCPGITGSKISGAGLGDCVVAVGNGDPENFEKLPLTMSSIGVQIEQE